MTQEEKSLLLQDLCARLPYGVQIYCEKGESKFNFTLYGIRGKLLIFKITYEEKTYSNGIVSKHYEYPIYSGFLKIICKPYLRPMSSMTEEEQTEFSQLIDSRLNGVDWKPWLLYDKTGIKNGIGGETIYFYDLDFIYDYLNAHYFDYRDLIPRGLALEAPKDMYKF